EADDLAQAERRAARPVLHAREVGEGVVLHRVEMDDVAGAWKKRREVRSVVVVAVAVIDEVRARVRDALLIALPRLAGLDELIGDRLTHGAWCGRDRELAVDLRDRRDRGRAGLVRVVERGGRGVGAGPGDRAYVAERRVVERRRPEREVRRARRVVP